MALAFVLGEAWALLGLSGFFLPLFVLPAVLIKAVTKPRTGCIAAAFLFCAAGFLLTGHQTEVFDCIGELEGCDVIVTGRVASVSETDYGRRLTLSSVTVIRGETVVSAPGVAVVLYSDDGYEDDETEAAGVGDAVTVTGQLCLYESARNPGNFDSRAYYKSLGVYGYVEADETYVDEDERDVVRSALAKFREYAASCIDLTCDDDRAGIFKAMILGMKDDIDDDIKELYESAGISHILSISGLHISIIGMFIYRLLRRKFLFVPSACVSFPVMVLFGILTGGRISAVRAIVMFAVMLLSDAAGRRYDMISAASAAMLLILFENPFALFNSGFILSFGAIAAICIVNRVVSEFVRFKRNAVCSVMSAFAFCLCINAAINPVIAFYYSELPTYSFILNLFIVPAAGIALSSGIIAMLLACAGCAAGLSFITGIARIAAMPGCGVLFLYERLAGLFERLPFSSVVTGKPSGALIAGYYIVLAALLAAAHIFSLARKRREELKEERFLKNYPKEGIPYDGHDRREERTRRIVGRFALFLAVACLMLSSLYIHTYDGLCITFIDVGQGDSIFIRNGSGSTFLIDGGSSDVSDVAEYRIGPFLKSQAAGSMDYVLISHADSDHTSGIISLMESGDIEIKNIVITANNPGDDSYAELVETAVENGVNVLYIRAGDEISEGALSLVCLYPTDDVNADDANDYSMVISLSYGGFSALFTGDVGADYESFFEDELEEKYTLLKVAHHGSKNSTSEEFLERISPEIAVISCGQDNSYGHPHEELLERLGAVGAAILRTDESGAVSVRTDGESVRVDLFL